DPGVGIVGEQVFPAIFRRPLAIVDNHPSGDRFAITVGTGGVLALIDRIHARARAGDRLAAARLWPTVSSLPPRPTMMVAGLRETDRLPGDFADVADPELPGLGIEPEAPRVAEAPGPDFAARGLGARSDRRVAAARAASSDRGDVGQRVVVGDLAVEVDP